MHRPSRTCICIPLANQPRFDSAFVFNVRFAEGGRSTGEIPDSARDFVPK
jgi:hypothetical protein